MTKDFTRYPYWVDIPDPIIEGTRSWTVKELLNVFRDRRRIIGTGVVIGGSSSHLNDYVARHGPLPPSPMLRWKEKMARGD